MTLMIMIKHRLKIIFNHNHQRHLRSIVYYMMKKTLLQLLFTACMFNAYSQWPTIHVSGSHIIGVCNDTIILRGINYAPFNWGWDSTDEKFSEIVQTGANCVRMVWYSSAAAGGGAPVYSTIANLDTAIARCIRNKMIAIIELHDNTCDSNYSQLATLSNWYLGSGVLAIINKYTRSLIINIANEAGYVQWANNPTTALADFKSTYESIAGNFRSAGINVPLMIDAPDCGTNLDDLASVAASMETADSLHNLIFSAHAYWYYYANNDSATMRGKITSALSKGVPIVLGEIANLQDDANPCQYTLNYKPLLKICQQLNVGWIAWSWDHDNCGARQISSTGYYANLTTYGNDIVHNAGYGLATHAATANNCSILNFTAFLQGFYRGGSAMINTLHNLGISSDTTATDSIKINLWASTHLSNAAPDYSTKTILHTNGSASVIFPTTVVNNSFYITVKHRNSLETWSAAPVTFTTTTSYNFTTGLAQAYSNGFNQPMKNMGGGVYAIWSGDAMQDGTIDASDMAAVDNGASHFQYGYNPSDCNGDGATDASDMAIIDNNTQLQLFFARPY